MGGRQRQLKKSRVRVEWFFRAKDKTSLLKFVYSSSSRLLLLSPPLQSGKEIHHGDLEDVLIRKGCGGLLFQGELFLKKGGLLAYVRIFAGQKEQDALIILPELSGALAQEFSQPCKAKVESLSYSWSKHRKTFEKAKQDAFFSKMWDATGRSPGSAYAPDSKYEP